MSRPVGDEPQGLDLAAIAADDALLDRLAAGDVAAAAVTPDTAGRDRAQTTDALT
ncbi:MAG: hypothetical protein JWM93_2230, partial [Frankiales bacterium]|nr:hypothetical protein [Frankiales bacterium]